MRRLLKLLAKGDGERYFRSMRQTWGLFLAPAASLFMLLLLGDSPQGRCAAIMAWVVLWWVSEALPLAATALLGSAASVFFGLASAKDAFAPFAHPLIFLFLGGFLLAQAMKVHGLDRRFALYILTRPGISGRPVQSVLAICAVSAFASMWISNTATVAMLLPICLRVLSAVFPEEPEATVLVLLAVAYSASIGGVLTPVGSPPNLIAMGYLSDQIGVHLSFTDWMFYAAPVGLLFLGIFLYVLSRKIARLKAIEGQAPLRKELETLGPLSLGEKNTIFAVALTVLLWVGPGLLGVLLGKDDAWVVFFREQLPEPVSAIFGAGLLFVLPENGRRTLSWPEAIEIDWGALLLFGGGLSLGGLMFKTGLAHELGEAMVRASLGSPFLFIVGSVLLAIFLTEATSNTATASMFVPLVIATSQRLGVDPLLCTVGVSIGCSFAFMLPVATPPNAIVFGSGRVPIQAMVRLGTWMNFLGAAILISAILLGQWL